MKNSEQQNEQQQEKWGKEVKRAYLKWPDENLIRFMNRNFRENKKNIRVLDLGCGAGRNTVALATEGFQVFSCDFSKECVEITKIRCESLEDCNCTIMQNNATNIPLDDNYLDAVVASGSIFLNNLKNRRLLMNEITRVLKTGGLFWADWRTTEDDLYKNGKQIEESFYLLNTLGYEGLSYYFASIDELKKLYKETDFEIINIEKLEITTFPLEKKNSWWHVSARKKYKKS